MLASAVNNIGTFSSALRVSSSVLSSHPIKRFFVFENVNFLRLCYRKS